MTTSDPRAWLQRAPWLPVDAPRKSSPAARRAEDYVQVVSQFDVEKTARYRARDGFTFCNIFVWDCTRALGCEIPHWFDKATGKPKGLGLGAEMSATMMVDWLRARRGGWRDVVEMDAHARAGLGFPVVVGWPNTRGPGHVAMLLPGGLIAQAGAQNYAMVPVAKGFGIDKTLSYFTHD